jgi:hypothetical protein
MSEPVRSDAPDSFTEHLTKAARTRKGRSLLAKLWPFALAAVTGFSSWVWSKTDSKAELQEAIALRQDRVLEQQRHDQVLKAIAELERKLLSEDVNNRGRVVKLEKDQYWAWRALTEVKAVALSGETAATRSRKVAAGAKMAHSFDLTADEVPPKLAFDQVFAKVAVP